MVAKAMNVDKDFITLARQWRIALKRAAFTEGIDKVKEVLEKEQELAITHQEKINEVIKEVEMGIEEATATETNRVKEIESNESIRQNIQHQGKADGTVKEIERVRVPETMEDIQLVENSIEIYPYKNKIEERLDQLVEIGKSSYSSASLDCSIWVPNPEVCKDKREFKAKVAAVKILGDNAEQREKSIR